MNLFSFPWLKRLTYVIVVFSLCTAIVEFASAFVLKRMDQGRDAFASGRHLYHPYRSHQLNPDYLRDFDTHGLKLHSDDGFRSDFEYAKDKPLDVFRIIMLGGSALYGIGAHLPYPREPSLKNDQTVSWFLEQKINTALAQELAGKRVQIINAGVSAYTTFHHLVYFNEILYEYAPDLLVFFDGHNDFYYYSIYNQWHDYSLGSVRLTEHVDARSFWFTTLTNVRFLARYSNFFLVVEKFMQARWQELEGSAFAQSTQARRLDDNFPDNINQVLDETIFKSYLQLKRLGELFGFEMMVYLQPQLVLEQDELLSSADQNLKSITLEYDPNKDRHTIRPFFSAAFARHEIDFVDVAEIASDGTVDTQLYLDYCHLSPAGAEVTAELMLPDLRDKVISILNNQGD